MTDAERIAAFLAKGGSIKTVEAAPAYGVDLQADKAKRAAAREERRYAEAERVHERRREMAHDFFFVGDREAGYAAMRGDFDR